MKKLSLKKHLTWSFHSMMWSLSVIENLFKYLSYRLTYKWTQLMKNFTSNNRWWEKLKLARMLNVSKKRSPREDLSQVTRRTRWKVCQAWIINKNNQMMVNNLVLKIWEGHLNQNLLRIHSLSLVQVNQRIHSKRNLYQRQRKLLVEECNWVKRKMLLSS